MIDHKVKNFWDAFISSGNKVSLSQCNVKVESFGNSKEMANELLELILKKEKTATSSAFWEYEYEKEELPKIGDYTIVLDGQNNPAAIIQTIKVEVMAFNEVSEEFAYKEGEGDQSLIFWQKVHEDFFRWVCDEIGKSFDENMPVVCEELELVFPK